MLADFHILAQNDDGGGTTLKIIIGLVFAGIWVVSQIITAMGKKKDQTSPEDYPVVLPPEAPVPQRSPPPRQAPPRRNPDRPVSERPAPVQYPSPRVEAPPVKHRRETHQRQRQQAKRPPPPPSAPPPRREEPVIRVPERIASFEPATPSAARAMPQSAQTAGAGMTAARRSPADGPNATQRLRAILRPKNLRKEFILTEILQPPLATRPKREID